ncbi:MAG: hypothetical protein KUG77_10285 [Nannocystaceae bacterium]|nr:hypothetical protein [Nannocystaceae bacterium]
MLGVSGCDDEVVGFAEVTNDGASTGVATASTGPEPSASSSTGLSLEDSSSGLAAQDGLPDYVAYGFEAGLAVSFEDGEAWTDVPALGEMPLREAMVRGEDRIVVVGGDRSATTLDGFAWDVSAFDVSGYARAVAYGSGGFVSVGFDHFAWSEDGQTWSDARGDLMGLDLVALAYGGGRFVAVGIDQVVTSENGQDWSATEAVGEKLTSVVFGDGRFVAVGELGRILETQDGVTILRDEASGLAGLGTIRFCDDTFVIGTANRYWLSPDADDWTEVASAGDGAFACSGTSWVLAKLEGLFWAPELGVFSPAHTAKSVFYEVEFTGLGSP